RPPPGRRGSRAGLTGGRGNRSSGTLVSQSRACPFSRRGRSRKRLDGSMVEAEFGAGQQRPYYLPARRARPVGTLAEVVRQGRRLLGTRRTAQHGPHGEVNLLLRFFQTCQPVHQAPRALSQQFLLQRVAVAEEQRLAHADLEVLGRK